MKNNYTKLFYQFLVNEGKLFDFLEMLATTNYKTLKKHCLINNPNRYIREAYNYSRNDKYDWVEKWKHLDESWKNELQRYNTKIKKKKK